MYDLKDRVKKLRYSLAQLLKELQPQVDEVQGLHSNAEDSGDADAELLTRIYWNTIQGIQDEAQRAHHYAKYILSRIDAAGQLVLNSRGRFQLPTTDRRDDYFEFSCGCSIEIFHEEEDVWLYGSVEHSDQYKHGYYFTGGNKIPLAPGIRARHRHINQWED